MEQGNKTSFWWVFQLKKQEGRETGHIKKEEQEKKKGREISGTFGEEKNDNNGTLILRLFFPFGVCERMNMIAEKI